MIRKIIGVVAVISALALYSGHASAMNGGSLSALPGAAKPGLLKVHDYYGPEFGRWRLRCDWDDDWCRRRYWRWRREGRDWWWNDRGQHWHWDRYERPRPRWRNRSEYCRYHPGYWRCEDY